MTPAALIRSVQWYNIHKNTQKHTKTHRKALFTLLDVVKRNTGYRHGVNFIYMRCQKELYTKVKRSQIPSPQRDPAINDAPQHGVKIPICFLILKKIVGIWLLFREMENRCQTPTHPEKERLHNSMQPLSEPPSSMDHLNLPTSAGALLKRERATRGYIIGWNASGMPGSSP